MVFVHAVVLVSLLVLWGWAMVSPGSLIAAVKELDELAKPLVKLVKNRFSRG